MGIRAFLLTLAMAFLLAPGTRLARQTTSTAQGSTPQAVSAPNTNPVYKQLRNIRMGDEIRTVENVALKRDAGTFTFKSGNFIFLAPVQGKITGAVFIGEGSFSLVPPLEVEKKNIKLLTKEAELNEEFNEAIFRFTDGTEQELRKLSSVPKGPVESPASELLADLQITLRKNLQYNLDARLLQDVLSTQPGGFFAAFIKGKKFSSKELYIIDPHGVDDISPKGLPGLSVAPEEIEFLTYADQKYGIWAAFHFSDEYGNGKASGAQQNGVIRIEHQNLDTTIEKNGKLSGIATTTFVPMSNSVRVVPFDLFHTLRVQKVTASDGQACDFIQEPKDEDSQFAVVLPKALALGERYTIQTTYSGVDAVKNVGEGNYYPISRSNWYPNSRFGQYATYDLTFRIPKELTMVATGEKVREADSADQNISEWKSNVPLAVAGFNFGKFKELQANLSKPDFMVETYVNPEPPDIIERLRHAHLLGTLETTTLAKKALGEEQLAIPLYTDYFGPIAYRHLAVTQQTAINFGQSWPMLVFLPMTSFFDKTQLEILGMGRAFDFFKEVGPHEIAHQWWGHAVGFNCYRDQWMSEGFAEFSASLFLQTFYKDEFENFWKEQRRLLTEKSQYEYRAIDVGPVTLGYRLFSTKAGFDIPRRLIYPKGAYILHMIRMMMWDMQQGDQRFKEMMHDFLRTYTNRPATTEDFKATVEKHMIPAMDLTGNGKTDWFFDEYVYGTALPSYKLDSSFSRSSDGTIQLNLKIAQSGVDEHFQMPVPVYLDLGNGHMFRLGMVPMHGNQIFEKQIALRGLKEEPRRVTLTYFSDLLCDRCQ